MTNSGTPEHSGEEQSDSTSPQSTKKRPSRLRRFLKWTAGLVLLLALVLGAALVILDEARPVAGITGEPADRLAEQIEVSTGQDAWQTLEAVSWRFAERNDHLWDRQRGMVRVRWEAHEVFLCLATGEGVVTESKADGEDNAALVDHALGAFYNDSFWLNPFGKLFDPGVTRSRIELAGEEALLVEFASGGRTPGDAYAIFVDDTGRPVRWQMWVSIIPIGGLSVSWEAWETLTSRGGENAQVSLKHEIGPLDLVLSEVRAGSVMQLEDEDPFAAVALDCVR